jgi:hypothetical protein
MFTRNAERYDELLVLSVTKSELFKPRLTQNGAPALVQNVPCGGYSGEISQLT